LASFGWKPAFIKQQPSAYMSGWGFNVSRRSESTKRTRSASFTRSASCKQRRRSTMIIALASPRVASSVEEGLDRIKQSLSEAVAQGAEIVCFPEAYFPGLRGQDFEVLPFDQTTQEWVIQTVGQWARTYAVATILGTERLTTTGRQIAAYVIDARGQ